jgi:DNA replication and repair protein RecF
MNIHRLTLCDFRNIEKVEISPDSGFNIFWGVNAQGKTNLLEAVYLLGNLKSFRGARNEEMIRHGRELSRLKGEVDCQGVRRRIELQIECHGKTGRVDGKESRSTGSFLGHLRPILFSPEEVNLIKGSPAGRRDLLDRAVFQADAAFLGRAQEYRRLLRQRNCLLRENRSRVEIQPWSEGLIRTGARIRHDRFIYIDRLLPLLREAYRNIAGGGEEADLQYTAGAPSVEKLEEALRRELERAEDRERKMGQTLAGPHRDDHRFMVNGRLLRLYGSQGQQRSFILAFKAAQIMDLENRTGEPPVLLLDDMTSELDRQRQGFFFRFLQARQGQVFITTTDIRSLIDEGFRQARFYRVSGGVVEEDCRE